jgi:osmotically-inducible protein OsmY
MTADLSAVVDPVAPRMAMKTDAELQVDVMDELKWRPNVDASHVSATVMNGVVTLTGHVATYAYKLVADEIVRQVRGVRGLADELELEAALGGWPDDTKLANAASLALNWDSDVPIHRISVAVRHGVVTLAGVVRWQFEKESAWRCVGRILGVTGIVDNVTVQPEVERVDIEGGIKAAFLRHATLDASEISVRSDEGRVTLVGRVSSWSERNDAVRTAWSAPGVTNVTDLLTLGRADAFADETLLASA